MEHIENSFPAQSLMVLDTSAAANGALLMFGSAERSIASGGSGLVDPIAGGQMNTVGIRVSGPLFRDSLAAVHEEILGAKTFQENELTTLVPVDTEVTATHKALRDTEHLAKRQVDLDSFAQEIQAKSQGYLDCIWEELGSDDCHAVASGRTKVVLARLETIVERAREHQHFDPATHFSYKDSVERSYVNTCLKSDVLLLHLDRTWLQNAAIQTATFDLLSRIVAVAHEASDEQPQIMLNRIVLAVGDVGLLQLCDQETPTLLSVPTPALFKAVFETAEAVNRRLRYLLLDLCNVVNRNRVESAQCDFIGVPYDAWGDLEQFECLNRDPLDPMNGLLTTASRKGDAGAEEDRKFWRPFNSGDALITAMAKRAQSDKAFVLHAPSNV